MIVAAAHEWVRASRQAQARWRWVPVRERRQWLRRMRGALAEAAEELVSLCAAARGRSCAEAMVSEVIPLLDACRWLERQAAGILAPRRLGWWGRPLWLGRVVTEVHREPHGVVLVIAPGNYPLLLAGVQSLQALAAGNSVILKPAPGSEALWERVQHLARGAGLDSALLQVLPAETETGRSTLRAGVDLVVLTGKAETGLEVLGECAGRLTPSIMELSGNDPVMVAADADLELVSRALEFGLRLNGGATCIAPRRVFVVREVASELERRLVACLRAGSVVPGPLGLDPETARCVREALARGARILAGDGGSEGRGWVGPLVLAGVEPSSSLLDRDFFAPVLSLVTVQDEEEAIRLANRSAYALGASVFSRSAANARRLAASLDAGVVVINDMIVPTADPRVPFGGRRRSGFGVTRGMEGLLAMTAPKVVSRRRGRARVHFRPLDDRLVQRVGAVVRMGYGVGWRARWRAIKDLVSGSGRRAVPVATDVEAAVNL